MPKLVTKEIIKVIKNHVFPNGKTASAVAPAIYQVGVGVSYSIAPALRRRPPAPP
jgi:hypothetical protein